MNWFERNRITILFVLVGALSVIHSITASYQRERIHRQGELILRQQEVLNELLGRCIDLDRDVRVLKFNSAKHSEAISESFQARRLP